MKHSEEIERNYIQCGPFSKQRKSLRCPPLEKLESALVAWFKQPHESNASIGGTHHKGKAFHIAACLDYRKQLIQKTVAMIDDRLLHDATQMKQDVLSAIHFIAEGWSLITLTAIKNCFMKCGFLIISTAMTVH